MRRCPPKRLWILFYILLLGLYIPHFVFCEIKIQSDQLEVSINENQGLFDVYQVSPHRLLDHEIKLGAILFPDDSQPLDITQENFPQIRYESQGKNRVDINFPSPKTKSTFYLALEVQGNNLFTALDTQPIKIVGSDEKPFHPGSESLELLQSPKEFMEISLLPNLIRLQKEETGNLVVPYQEGSLINFSHNIQKERDFDLYENSGLTMPFWGVSTPKHTEVCIVDYLYMRLLLSPESDSLYLRPQFLPDPYNRPLRMQVHFLGENHTYLDTAKTYRRYLQERKELPSLENKLRQKPQLIQLLEGVNIKFPIYMSAEQRPKADNLTPPPRIRNYQSFTDVKDILVDMKANGVDRLMAVWWGWGKEGYDRLHPDILPPNPERGGVAVFADINSQIDQMGFAAGFHDNYTDIYETAPSFEQGIHCVVGSEGQNRKGGFWAGGQCWLLCSTEGLQFAKRNFEAMKDLGPIRACFIDVLTAAPLFDCFSLVHPHTKWGDLENKRAMMRLVTEHFGIMGTEHGFSWGIDLCDYFEGITNDPHTREDFFATFGTSVPLFAAVFHDAVLQYMHQAAPVERNAPDRLLFNLRAGGSSYFNVVLRNYQNPEWKDYFMRAYRISADTIRRTWKTPLTEHSFLSADKKVELCRYGNDIIIIINRSDTEFQGTIGCDLLGQSAPATDMVLAPHGFLVSAPDYAALNGSRWGNLKLERSGWITFQTSDGRTLHSADDIQVMNFDQETKINNDLKIVIPKGPSALKISRLFKK